MQLYVKNLVTHFSATLCIKIIHTEATLFRENYVNRLCKTWTAVSDSRLMVAHARILLPIELLKKIFSCRTQWSYVPNLVKIGP